MELTGPDFEVIVRHLPENHEKMSVEIYGLPAKI
jgi:hypothetical protein